MRLADFIATFRHNKTPSHKYAGGPCRKRKNYEEQAQQPILRNMAGWDLTVANTGYHSCKPKKRKKNGSFV